MENITVREESIDVAVGVCMTIREFTDSCDRKHFEDRYRGKERLILVAYAGENPAWFLVAYRKDTDGSFYCWMTGVDPLFRRIWVLRHLMANLERWCRDHGYGKITIKTRNSRRAMLSYLIESWFQFTGVERGVPLEESRIFLEKALV